MAEIRKIARRPELSTFQREASTGGSATLLALAGTMNAAYERLRPAAMQRMVQEADADWAGQARRDMGNPGGMVTSSGGGPSIGHDESGLSQEARTAFAALEGASGRTLRVNSAYRDPEHNAKVGGAKNSQHTHGNAFDVDVSDLSQDERIDLIKKARASGFRGIGVYNNSLHFDVGGDRAWGPSYGRESLPAWAAEAIGVPVGGNVTMSTQSAPPTVIQTADGSLQPRLYSPASHEILQAYNAAAQVLYRNEAELETTAALMNLSNQYTLDPDGFQQAAKGYIEETLKNVPDMFRPELRAVMGDQVQRRALGILEDKQADIRQRASNSNQALIDRHSNTLSEALVAGNPDAIMRAENDLLTQLRVREAIPGLAWTFEQSENEILRARERAGATATTNRNKQKAEMDRQLRAVREAADAGLTSAYDAILMGPFTDLVDPVLLMEATAAKMRQEAFPNFAGMTPDDRKAAIADLRAQPVTSVMDVKAVEAFERVDRAATEAFQQDPIEAAERYLTQKPPELPPISDPQAYGQGLKARLEYGRMLNANGYTQGVPLFTKQEREQAGALFSKGVPAEAKMVAALAVVEALGEDAGLFFEQANSDDKVSLVVGQMLASGGDATVGLEAMRGQEMLDAGVAKRPKVPPVQAVSTDIATALSGLMMPDTVTDVAAAILVARGHSETDLTKTEGKKQMEAAVQAALGQTSDPVSKKTFGGVQTVVREPTFLPPDISGQDLSIAIERAMTADMGAFETAVAGMVGGARAFDRGPELWQAAGALGAPHIGGATVPSNRMGDVVVRPVGNSGMYQLFVKRADGGMTPAHVQMAPNIPYLFSPAELIRATQ